MNLDLLAQLFEDGPMPLIRTDFTDDAAWQRIIGEVSKQHAEGYEPNIAPVAERGFDGVTAAALAASWPRDAVGYVILADARSMREASDGGSLTVSLVDLYADEEDEAEFGDVFGREFRCEASEVASIEANLSIANVDFSDFADAVGKDGVLRGFAD